MPFYLITFKRMYRNQMACSNTNPILNFALGKDVDENRVLMNATAGADMGLKDGDSVVVETRIGKVTGKVQLTEQGFGRTASDWAMGLGPPSAAWPREARERATIV